MHKPVSLAVLGSINLDMVARCARLPVAGQTVAATDFHQYPGGKGANQALAARRLGADVSLFAAMGDDGNAALATALLRADGVDMTHVVTLAGVSTGVALIGVGANGENQIIVVGGANQAMPTPTEPIKADGLLAQLEVPVATIAETVQGFSGVVALNLAPAKQVPERLLARADIIFVNQTEYAFYGKSLDAMDALIVLTLGAHGAQVMRHGEILVEAGAFPVAVEDTTGAGDCFCAAFMCAHLNGLDLADTLDYACAAAGLATTKKGAQPAMPWQADVAALLAR